MLNSKIVLALTALVAFSTLVVAQDATPKLTPSADTNTAANAKAGALKQADKDGAFKGKVTQIFEPRGGAMVIVNFDTNYRNAMTALLKKDSFDKFPALTNLLTRKVLVSGKFINYQGRAEIILTNAGQIKLVE